ncbi:hypothetical protein CPB83DRAFT_795269 [Crepidotus variabilis]|uniref:Uncharacterized protein n=1 Tax=Crepidotus variabilis TaxID=179855 RepID=A0A9P6EBL5_9AGAR|nr:hypothetical protein CPB83DRAFT_795269 [Crepidotus variabilis]
MSALWPLQPQSPLPKPNMPSSQYDSYNAKTTSVSYPWPKEVTPVERIALAAQGDLQRVLSAFFARPIVVALVYSQTTHQPTPTSAFIPLPSVPPPPGIISSTSAASPIVQTRQVHLQCGGRIVCTATSTVRITSPEVAHLFLQEKYAIGQMFRRMEKVPQFELLAVGFGAVKDKEDDQVVQSYTADVRRQLWRKYTLVMPHFECEILEVFPDRRMFSSSEMWLSGEMDAKGQHYNYSGSVPELLALQRGGDGSSAMNTGVKVVVVVGFLIMAAFEATRLFGGKMFC